MIWQFCTISFLLQISYDFAETKSFDGAQVWNVHTRSHGLIHEIEELQDIDLWKKRNDGDEFSLDILIPKDSLTSMRMLLQHYDASFNVTINNIQNVLLNQSIPVETENRDGKPIGWTTYHKLSDIYNYIDFVKLNNRDFVSTYTIGYSVQNRPIRVVVLSNKNPKNKQIWIDGGVHAREWISPAAVTYIINELVEEWSNLPHTLKNIDWHFLPVANPDGYEFSQKENRLWRKNRARNSQSNCFGVDLNRNFGYKWGGKGTSKSPCSEIFSGPSPFSEPESNSIRKYLESLNRSLDAFLSIHSYGQYILYPWGYDTAVPPNFKEMDEIGKKAATVSII